MVSVCKRLMNCFPGLVWSGEQALELGLIDGLGSPGSVARDVIGHEDIVNYTPQESPLERLTQSLGTAMGAQLKQLFVSDYIQLR